MAFWCGGKVVYTQIVMKAKTKNTKVLVLMSGGVDSSVAAALLKKQANSREFKKLTGRPAPKGFRGYDVTGVYLKLWGGKTDAAKTGWEIGDPCWINDKRDAQQVAAKLKIPFFVLDVTREYQKRVMDYFLREYAAGRTPNPDVMCNKEIKFGFVLEKALSLGYDYVATGHYARIICHSESHHDGTRNPIRIIKKKCVGSLADVRDDTMCGYSLLTAEDTNKDQSYFLWTLTQKQLGRILFPIGNYTKPQVRQMAKKFGLPTWQKKDSQGICFLGKVDVADFLKKRLKPKKGTILDTHGNILGTHDGLPLYTIGQRHGMNIQTGNGPYFVVSKNTKTNTLIVAQAKDEKKYFSRELIIGNLNWIAGQKPTNKIIRARIRYRAPLKKVKIIFGKKPNQCRVVFQKPERAAAEGQSIVFYSKNQCLGGGVII